MAGIEGKMDKLAAWLDEYPNISLRCNNLNYQ